MSNNLKRSEGSVLRWRVTGECSSSVGAREGGDGDRTRRRGDEGMRGDALAQPASDEGQEGEVPLDTKCSDTGVPHERWDGCRQLWCRELLAITAGRRSATAPQVL